MLGRGTLLRAHAPVLIPSVNMTKGSVQMFKTAHDPRLVTDYRRRAADVAMATSAAPTFFPLAEIDGAYFADGGLVANAPDMCALHEACVFLGTKADDVSILSIGTTTTGSLCLARWDADWESGNGLQEAACSRLSSQHSSKWSTSCSDISSETDISGLTCARVKNSRPTSHSTSRMRTHRARSGDWPRGVISRLRRMPYLFRCSRIQAQHPSSITQSLPESLTL